MATELSGSIDLLPQLYEELRNRVLHPDAEPWAGSRPLGFGVLFRRGMCAWIETRTRLTSVVEPTPHRSFHLPVPLPQSTPAQLASVLASALLNPS